MKNKFLIIASLVLSMIVSCNDKTSKDNTLINSKTDSLRDSLKKDIISSIRQPNSDEIKNINDSIKEKTKVLVVLCSNGYEYSSKGFDFNPVIERELKKQSKFEIIPFSYKKLTGVTYQGVYDKKYAQPIIEKIDANILVMTRFTGNIYPEVPNNNKVYWGYECKLLNTKTGSQRTSIGANYLAKYEDIEKDIIKNTWKLINDIERIK